MLYVADFNLYLGFAAVIAATAPANSIKVAKPRSSGDVPPHTRALTVEVLVGKIRKNQSSTQGRPDEGVLSFILYSMFIRVFRTSFHHPLKFYPAPTCMNISVANCGHCCHGEIQRSTIAFTLRASTPFNAQCLKTSSSSRTSSSSSSIIIQGDNIEQGRTRSLRDCSPMISSKEQTWMWLQHASWQPCQMEPLTKQHFARD
eukprot:2756214-Amphidinium_carterae.1